MNQTENETEETPRPRRWRHRKRFWLPCGAGLPRGGDGVRLAWSDRAGDRRAPSGSWRGSSRVRMRSSPVRPRRVSVASTCSVDKNFVPHVRLNEVEVYTKTGRRVAVLPALRTTLRAGPVLRGRIEPRNLHISGAQISLSRLDDGRLDLALDGSGTVPGRGDERRGVTRRGRPSLRAAGLAAISSASTSRTWTCASMTSGAGVRGRRRAAGSVLIRLPRKSPSASAPHLPKPGGNRRGPRRR